MRWPEVILTTGMFHLRATAAMRSMISGVSMPMGVRGTMAQVSLSRCRMAPSGAVSLMVTSWGRAVRPRRLDHDQQHLEGFGGVQGMRHARGMAMACPAAHVVHGLADGHPGPPSSTRTSASPGEVCALMPSPRRG
jgi:hypothetical protein